MLVAVVLNTTGQTIIDKKVGPLNANPSTLSSLWVIVSVVTLGVALIEAARASPRTLVVTWTSIHTNCLVPTAKKLTVYIISALAYTLKVRLSLICFQATHLEIAIVASLFANSGLIYMCTCGIERVPNMLTRLRQGR